MPPIKHALLGASSAKRWMTCPPSARWEATLPEPEEQDYTIEGTMAHELAEAKLRDFLRHKGHADQVRRQFKDHRLYNEAMERHTDDYVTTVTDIYAGYELAGLEPHLYMETRVDFSKWVPEGFGTSDVIIVAGNIMHIIDLKYGKGVPVEAKGNPQLRCYALGAWQAFKALEDIDTIVMEIIQPRLDSDTRDQMPIDELIRWADEELAPKAQQAFLGEGEFNPDDEACRFCRGRNICRYNAAKQLELGRLEGKEGPELSETEIAGILERVDGLTKWATGLKEWALDQAVNHGKSFPGYKLVEGRSNRVITDKTVAIEKLGEAGYGPDKTCKLLGMTDLEKLVGKKKLTEVLEGLIDKPEGKPTLVKDSDKRPALDLSAQYNDYFKE